MTVTTRSLTQAAGVAAVAAGTIFVAVQINHPGMGTFLTETDQWVVRCLAKAVMCVLALAGITGMYLRQVRQLRLLGLTGYLTFALGYLLILCTVVMAAVFLPALSQTAPQFVDDVVAANEGGSPTGDIGHLQILFTVTGACYMVGGLLFGIALFRARVLARWAAVLLAVSTVGTAALAVLPDAFNRPLAVPEGIALIGLGVSLWSDQRRRGDGAAQTAAPEAAAVR